MIPSDLAARLKLLSESIVQPVTPVRAVTADLPELPVGHRFTARIENALPDGTFRAIVADRRLTLALPQSASPGETLDLVVTARTPRMIIAESAADGSGRPSTPAAQATPAAPAAPAPTLSPAGRIISTLLSGEGRTPQAATISRATPLLPEPPLQAARLAPVLQLAVAESGLFYESHQAQWVAGRYPAEALAREPQARIAPRSPQARSDAAQSGNAPTAAVAAPEELPEAPLSRSGAEQVAGRSATAAGPGLPAELHSLVQQQLDAFATQHIVWRGEVWPGQNLQWEIAAYEQGHEAPEGETAEQWTTSLVLSLPRLGEVHVALRMTPAKVSLDMTASEGAAALKQGLGDLVASFEAAGLPPVAAQVGQAGSHEPA